MSELFLLQPTVSGGRIEPVPQEGQVTSSKAVSREKAIVDIADIVGPRITGSHILTREMGIMRRSLETDFEWFLEATQEQASFKGKFVAIYNRKIIASGTTFKEALVRGRERLGGKMPLVSIVPKEEALEV